MAFDFPSSPTTGQQFTPAAGGPTYTWNGTIWDTAPPLVVPGTLVELKRFTVTTGPVAVVDFTGVINSTYDEYELHFFGVQCDTAGSAILIRISQDNGATFKNGTSDYGWGAYFASYDIAVSAPVGSTASGSPQVHITSILAASANAFACGRVFFSLPSFSSGRKPFLFQSFQAHQTQGYSSWTGWGQYGADGNAFNAIRVAVSAGLMTGVFVLYGVSKTPIAPPNYPSGAKVLIQTQTVGAAVAAVSFTTGIDATYDEYELTFNNIAFSAVDNNLGLQISIDGGATWKTDANYAFGYRLVGQAGTPADVQGTAGTAVPIGTQHNSAATNAPISGIIRFWRPSAATFHNFMFDSLTTGTTTGLTRNTGAGGYIGSGGGSAFNALRLMVYQGSNLTSGTFNLYGIKK